MKSFRHPFFALLLSLLLIGSQQAAFAHLLSHVQGRSAAVTQSVTQYQADHSALDGTAETCTTCIAFAGTGGGAPPTAAAVLFAGIAVGDNYLLPAEVPVFTRPVVNSRARAPPAFL